MKKWIKKRFKGFLEWAFSEEFNNMRTTCEQQQRTTTQMQKEIEDLRILQNQLGIYEKKLKSLLGSISVSANLPKKAENWAVISIQGEKIDYVKFIALPKNDMIAISRFLAQFQDHALETSPANYDLINGKIIEIKNNKQ
jgi:hypothetical protein|nr:MAG TPA: hypothetical protein [Herelleviridae sp.]